MLGVYSESGDELELTSDPVEIALITYTSCLQKNICPKLLFLLQENGFAFLQCLCKKATPGTILETYFTKNDGSLLHLYLCLLPDCEPSRHAGYGHPYTIYELLKKVKTTSSTLLVFLILRDPQKETFAACCAVSRAFPLYTLSSSKSLEVDLKIFISSSVSSHSSDDILLVCRNIRNTARLVDMPPNVLNPATYQKFIREWVEGLPGVTIEVLEGEELRARGLGGLYSVGKASADPPALVILSYSHASAAKPVCLVGKGITFDTGGLSLKTRTGMCGMKMDMGGSAGAFVSLVESGKLKTSLHCLLCIAENSVSSKATRPDDVHLLYSGKSVEVNNPDAEGRLVLADGLAYAAKRYAPGLLVDMATLTGAQGTATEINMPLSTPAARKSRRSQSRAGRSAEISAIRYPTRLNFCCPSSILPWQT
ncbi:probable aminopeptidase NPEPL1 isoform X2 [Zophobas morio]|uniref:probable aminopeptidase NPEPL1 isoform X2 n=1 Tax=Zophobas morio TaxID=2755281 RepID=UPI003082CEE7